MPKVEVIDVSPRIVAIVRVTTVLARWPREFRTPLDKVWAAVRAGRVAKGGHNVMVYYPRRDGLVDIECGIEVTSPFEPVGELMCSQTPKGKVAAMAHRGPYDQLRLSHQAIDDWCRQLGHSVSGKCWEIYGDWEEDPMKLRTDLFHLLQS